MGQVPRFVMLSKKRGETPLEALTAWKSTHPEFAEVPASYAGRLDPMAEGKLLVLLGEECKKQEKYTKLDKEYEIEVLLGAGTDTGDVLGLVGTQPNSGSQNSVASHASQQTLPVLFMRTVAEVLKSEQGSHSRKYPVFSSKTVRGKPLFVYALEGTLDTISIPEHSETIYGIRLRSVRALSKGELQKVIGEHLSVVPRSDEPSKALGADFRQDAVRETWSEFFAATTQKEFVVLTLAVTCESGSYMRTLAGRIGKGLGTEALALSIKRTRLGKFLPLPARWGVWLTSY